MGVKANVTELANSALPGRMLASIVSPAFSKTNVMMNHVMLEDLPPPGQGNVVGFVKKGALSNAALLVESTDTTYGSGGELTDTVVEATAVKAVSTSGQSVESKRFGRQPLSRIIEEQAADLARMVDTDILTDFSALSQSQTSTTILTLDDLMEAKFQILANDVPNPEVELQYIARAREVVNIQKEIKDAGASAWSNPDMISILSGSPAPNGYQGSIPGICGVWMTSGFGTSASDTITALLHPRWTYGIAIDPMPQVLVGEKITEGFYTEVGSYIFYDVVEVNDLAGVKVLSDTSNP